MYCSSWEDVKLIRLGGTLCSWSRDDLKLGLEWQSPARAGRHVKTYPALDRGVKHRRPRAGLKCRTASGQRKMAPRRRPLARASGVCGWVGTQGPWGWTQKPPAVAPGKGTVGCCGWVGPRRPWVWTRKPPSVAPGKGTVVALSWEGAREPHAARTL